MKKLSLLLLLLLLVVASTNAQTSTARIRTGSTLPASCSPTGNNVFFLSSNEINAIGLYTCTSANTWTYAGIYVAGFVSVSGTIPKFTSNTQLGLSHIIDDDNTITNGLPTIITNLNIVPVAGDKASPANGDIWYNDTTHKFRVYQDGAAQDMVVSGAGTGDFSSNTSTSVVNEIMLFADTTGKLGKRATGTGIASVTSGVLGTITTSAGIASALSDETGSGALVFANTPTLVTPTIGVATATSINKVAITAPATSATLTITDGKTASFSNSITFAGTDSTTMTFPEASRNIGMREAVQNSQSAAYTTVLADSGKSIYHPSADTSARTWTIDSNANVAYPIGTTITFINDCSAGTITIAITSDTLVLANTGSTGSRTLAACGIATAIKVTATRWIINGTGLT